MSQLFIARQVPYWGFNIDLFVQCSQLFRKVSIILTPISLTNQKEAVRGEAICLRSAGNVCGITGGTLVLVLSQVLSAMTM